MSVISNVEIMGLDSSLVASGYPMRTDADLREVNENDLKRAKNLIKASRTNGAHGQFLSGIIVNFDLTFSNKAWVEAERYRFLTFVSSESTMHRIAKFDIKSQCNEYVTPNTIAEMERLKDIYNKFPTPENYLTLLYNIPSGFQLTARMTTNYRCLLNIYLQRREHKLKEWRQFCEELLTLPCFKEFVEIYEEEAN